MAEITCYYGPLGCDGGKVNCRERNPKQIHHENEKSQWIRWLHPWWVLCACASAGFLLLPSLAPRSHSESVSVRKATPGSEPDVRQSVFHSENRTPRVKFRRQFDFLLRGFQFAGLLDVGPRLASPLFPASAILPPRRTSSAPQRTCLTCCPPFFVLHPFPQALDLGANFASHQLYRPPTAERSENTHNREYQPNQKIWICLAC